MAGEDGLIPAAGGEGAMQEYQGDLGFSDETPETSVDEQLTSDIPDGDTSGEDTAAEEETTVEGTDTQTPSALSFTFRDKTYSDPAEYSAAVNQYMNSWEGRWRAQQQQLQEAENTNRRWEEWYNYQEQQAARGKEPEPAPKEPLDAIDWKEVQHVAQQYGPAAAVKHALKGVLPEMRRQIEGEFRTAFEQIAEPVKAQEATRMVNEYATNLWMNMVNRVDPENGTPTFPELYEDGAQFDPDAARAVLNNWLQIRQVNPDFAHTPAGIQQAYNNFRLWALQNNYQGPQARTETASQAANAAADMVRDSQGRFVKKQQARNDAASGGSSTPTPGPDNSGGKPQSMSEAAQRRRIRDAGRKNVTEKDRAAMSIFGVV